MDAFRFWRLAVLLSVLSAWPSSFPSSALGRPPFRPQFEYASHRLVTQHERNMQLVESVNGSGGGPMANSNALTCQTCNRCFSRPENLARHRASRESVASCYINANETNTV